MKNPFNKIFAGYAKYKKPIWCNTLITVGLAMLGAGVFFWLGLGQALAIPGAIITALGIFGATR